MITSDTLFSTTNSTSPTNTESATGTAPATSAGRDPGPHPPEPSWRVLDDQDLLSRRAVQTNKDHLSIAKLCTVAPTDIVHDVVSRLAVRLGVSETLAMTYVTIGMMLVNYPHLAADVSRGHWSFTHLRRLAESVELIPEEHRQAVEDDLLTALAPKRPNQAIPSVKKLGMICRQVIEKHYAPARPKDEDEELPPKPPPSSQQPELGWDERGTDATEFFLRLNKADSEEVIQMIRYVSRTQDCTRGEALMMLLRGQATAKITLNIYRPVFGDGAGSAAQAATEATSGPSAAASATAGSTGGEDARVWVAGQWLESMVSREWLSRVTHIVAPGWARCEGYHPTETIKASVRGRDGHCRFPGCDVPAQRCDVDHVRRWDHHLPGGGLSETSTDNLHCLCRKHHKLKTAGQWDVSLRRDGSEEWTSFGDGHTVTTEPGGVLGRECFERRASRRARVLAEFNADRLERLEELRRQAEQARAEARAAFDRKAKADAGSDADSDVGADAEPEANNTTEPAEPTTEEGDDNYDDCPF